MTDEHSYPQSSDAYFLSHLVPFVFEFGRILVEAFLHLINHTLTGRQQACVNFVPRGSLAMLCG